MTDASIAYFSMEVALEPGIPTYSGGLGVLAGDTLRSAADLGVPVVGVSLLYRRGYFFQRIDPSGSQSEEPVEWVVEDFLEELPARASVTIEGREVQLRAWKFEIVGVAGSRVPVLLLDSDLPENTEWDRTLTHSLYGGDEHYRICQEAILGIGGLRMLRALGYRQLRRFHLNEGHASLLVLALLDEEAARSGRTAFTPEDVEAVRRQCVFTTHTPVAAGHDRFPMDLVTRVLGHPEIGAKRDLFLHEDTLNLTFLALNFSRYVNGVAKKHAEVSRLMFAHYRIDSITNGVHVGTWTCEPFRTLFDRYIPGWRDDNFSLRYALSIPVAEVQAAHEKAKDALIDFVNRETNGGMDTRVLTLGFARRAATYKRADLVLSDVERLRRISREVGPLQIIFAGKAHPRDTEGKEVIRRIHRASESLRGEIRIAYLPNYDWELGALLTSGVDVWLNTPQRPLEASGTSGMKAAINGVPSLSILDGWWIEGCIEGITGWAVGSPAGSSESADTSAGDDATALYDKLEKVILPLYEKDRERFVDVMRHAIALNGAYFNTHRMLLQYVRKAYADLQVTADGAPVFKPRAAPSA